MSTFIDFFDAGVRSHANAVCLQDASGTHTYRQVQEASCRIARGLHARGFEGGFHGAVLSGNVSQALVAIMGICRASGVWLPVGVRNSADTNSDFLSDMDCDVLFYQARWKDQLRLIREKAPRIRLYICLDSETEGELSLQTLMDGQSGEMFTPDWAPDATQAIMSTGGTTGRSKGAMLSNRNIASAYASYMSVFYIRQRMTMLAAAPISHTTFVFAVPFMARGCKLVLVDGVDPQSLMLTIQEEKINILFLPPTLLYMVLAQPNVRDFDYSSLTHMLYGAAPTSPDKLKEAIEVFGPVMIQMYGQTEVPGAISAFQLEEHFIEGKAAPRERLMSAGRVHPFVRIALLDDDGNVTTRPGVRGEILAQGETVMKGYYKNPEANAAVRFGAWHRTGDVGVFDEDGYLTLVDRAKDMIITGGFNVYSTEVEAAVNAHPAVQDCGVIGVPDDKWGEAVKAVVELRPGHSVDAETLQQFVKDRLGSVKSPKTVDFVEQLPRSPVGKVLKKELRARYWAGRDRAIS